MPHVFGCKQAQQGWAVSRAKVAGEVGSASAQLLLVLLYTSMLPAGAQLRALPGSGIIASQWQGRDWVGSLGLLTAALPVAASEHGSFWAAVHGFLARKEHD
jgi:hypothetical protein